MSSVMKEVYQSLENRKDKSLELFMSYNRCNLTPFEFFENYPT